MAGAGKQRARAERKNGNGNGKDNSSSENGKSSNSPTSQPANKSTSSGSPTSGSSPPHFDGNRDPQPALQAIEEERVHRNMDLGLANSYRMKGFALPGDIPQRPKVPNRTGKTIQVKLNTFHVAGLPSKPIYQYDVQVDGGGELVKRGLIRRAWQSKAVLDKVGRGWIFDGNKIAYSTVSLASDVVIDVDLDQENNKQPRVDRKTKQPKPDAHKVRVRKVKKVRIDNLQSFLDGVKLDWDDECRESMTFLDHLLRETPSRTLTSIKRNFFHHGRQRTLLGGGVEAMKGVYASMRPVGDAPGSAKISVNVDVANTTFWSAGQLPILAKDVCGARDVPTLIQHLRPKDSRGTTQAFQMLRRLHRVHVTCDHRNGEVDNFVIEKFLLVRPKDMKFKIYNEKTGENDIETNVERHMQQQYGKRLQYPDLPLVKMTKGESTYIPMELCKVTENQRYAFKLSDKQTMEMIKFAVTLPQVRWQDIMDGVNMLNWGSDLYLQNYGLRINPAPATVPSQLLPPPKVQFANGANNPLYSGRWDLRGKKFFGAHPTPIKSWGVCVVPGRGSIDHASVLAFVQEFIRVFEQHGGKVANKSPIIEKGVGDAAQCVEHLWNSAGDAAKIAPQILFFIVMDKASDVYQRIKKSTDCRYGVVSQVLQSAHVVRKQAQYCSNVAMKVNAKLGGSTSQAIGVRPAGWFLKPTMIIGADVSHGAPGSAASSIAAVTVSWDRLCLKYAAAVETNGVRTEMITKANWESMLKPLVQQWIKAVSGGKFPQHVFYFRDGVSEGQYSQVREQEISAIKEVIASINPKAAAETKYTALTCTKRHHVRFFPDKAAADRNGNPNPGTLVSYGVTSPKEYDFYLCAHSAIKGTARPVHYYVLLDEAKMGVEDLQNMIYEASYQYVRSTTPVSLFPAIYYAHLAAARATSHLDQPSESSGQEEKTVTASTKKDDKEPDVKPLLSMLNSRGIRGAMWYV